MSLWYCPLCGERNLPALDYLCMWCLNRGPGLCGGVQRGETKSAGDTTGGARGGSRLGNPCDEDGLTR